MKLSEAILLGSTVLASRAGGQHFADQNAGCALGMAAIARGCSFGPATRPVEEQDRRTLGTEGVWGRWVLEVVKRPCDCWRFRVPREMRIKDIIAHLFDHHVVAKKNWTIEGLAEWVKAVEPAETIECHRPEPLPRLGSSTSWFVKRMSRDTASEEEQEWQKLRDSVVAKHDDRRRRSRL